MKPYNAKPGFDFALLLSLSFALPGMVFAAVTDLSNAPLSSGIGGSTVVKPNIAMVVDDSWSMAWDNMPDGYNFWTASIVNKTRNCFGWYKYNTLAYNPAYKYKPPFKLDGTTYTDGVKRYPDASFAAALTDGYFTAAEATYDNGTNHVVNLATAPLQNGASTRYYYSTHNSSTTASDCQAGANYTLVTSSASIAAPGVVAGSAAALTNYANWYSYYRNRAAVMKAAAGEAFSGLDESKYRIGLFYLNSANSSSTAKTDNTDLKIADFNGSASGTQRFDWYEKLYKARTKTTANTPLRAALSRMGRMYAGKESGWDPVQYSCQQNFTILSTDGQWNSSNENAAYGPLDLDNVAVGDRDGMKIDAVSAKATLTVNESEFGSNTCFRADSLKVGVTELLNTSPIKPASCPNGNGASTIAQRADDFGTALATSINAHTGTSGFSALYNATANTLTLTAPTSLGALNATPTIIKKLYDGSTTTKTPLAMAAFGGGVNAQAGVADMPYGDKYQEPDTLADVAYYYYQTDLRTSALNNCSNTIGGTTYTSLCLDNVLGSGKDTNDKQHMTTFTLGLGVNGTITYESNYETANDISGVTQYYDIVNGSAFWPVPDDDEGKIDDLWHAAVNGRGTYYAASNADSLKTGLQAALSGVKARTGSSAAAATSNLEPVAGDNYVYVALYRTQLWDGDLKAFEINPDTGALTGSELWSAQAKLDEQVTSAGSGDGRTIKYFSAGGTSKLKDFDATNLTADSLHTYFSGLCSDATKVPAVAQCTTLTTAQKAVANNAENLVNFLRGRRVHEDEASNAVTDNKVYRDREHVLGDIVNAVPVYMKKPPFSYDQYDTTYATFKTNNASRAPTVFIAANDGMLHAINATSDSTATAEYANRGKERWAYVPRAVMKNMWKLADTDYGDNHAYFVDGSPTVADICVDLATSDTQMCKSATDWRTIVIGGLNKGGCSYYALDVTDPANPKGMWEFSHANLGMSYGNPVVGKNKAGKWVVIFSSGYNNYPSNDCGNAGGDGNGHVFVVDAVTGALLADGDIPTLAPDGSGGTVAAGDTTTPSGLAKLNAWINNPHLPIIDRLYGGDLLGNLWRIDFDNNHLPNGKETVRLAQFKIGTTPQPITTKPELAEVQVGGTAYPVVMVGTGKYLGSNDLNDTSQQTIYAVKDSLLATGISNSRGTNMQVRTMTQSTGTSGSVLGRTIRTITGSAVDWATNDGWYLDLNPSNLSPGERVNVDMSLQFNILTVAANVPDDNACVVGGYAFLYFLDFNTGKQLTTSPNNMAGVRLGSNALVAGIKTLRLSSGKTVTVVTDTAGGVGSEDNPSATGGGSSVARRTTWREIQD